MPAAMFLALLSATPAQAWWEKPEMAWPIAIAGISLLAILFLVMPKVAASFRARGKQGVLDPIQVEELLLGSSPLIVDIRDAADFKGKHGHLRGSICMPYAEVPKRFEELRCNPPRPVIVVDTSDDRSYKVSDFLKKQGFDWIYVLKGGIRAWRRDRLPMYH